jgi:hypothetical protein
MEERRMPSSAFSPKKYIEKLIQYWWVLFLTIVIGGLIGTGLSLLRPPRYEAAAMISTSIDYSLLPELEDYEEDRIINEAGWVMLSDEVLLTVQHQADDAGISVSFEEMLDRFSADRIDDLWSLRVVGADPKAAADLANLWVDEAHQQLTKARAFALEASAIRSAIAALESCRQGDVDQGPGLTLCESADRDSLQTELETLTVELDEALALSRGLNPASSYTINRYSQIPTSPSYQARGVMAMLGMLLGLVSGLVALWFIGKKE